MSTSRRGQGAGEGDSPVAPPIPSFASLRAPRRSHPAMDVLAPPPVATRSRAESRSQAAPPPPARPSRQAGPVAPRPAEWPDLLRFGVRLAQGALRLPGALACLPARRLRQFLGE